jgi:hypothetical protein
MHVLQEVKKLSESKITDLEEARKFCEDQIKKNK